MGLVQGGVPLPQSLSRVGAFLALLPSSKPSFLDPLKESKSPFIAFPSDRLPFHLRSITPSVGPDIHIHSYDSTMAHVLTGDN